MSGANSVEKKIDRLTKLVGTIAEDVVGIDERLAELATKDQMGALHTQVNSIETQLRSMQHVKLQGRVAVSRKKSSVTPAPD
jgi:hypothetical protein